MNIIVNQTFHEQAHCHYNTTHLLVKYEFQISLIQDYGAEEGKSDRQILLHVGTIPSFTEKSAKSLAKVFDCNLRDTAAIQTHIKEHETWLSAVDESGLSRRLKAWMVLWPLLMYEVALSTAETLERKISGN